MIPAINRFLVHDLQFETLTVPGVLIHQCSFDKEAYHDEFFNVLGIDYPQKLNRAVPKRKAEFLAGRHCAKTLLAELGIHDFTIVPDKNRCPLWPPGIKGSISHSNTNALVMLTTRTDVLGVGIDIESVIKTKTMNDVKKSIIFDHEYDLLEQGDVSAETIFSLLFSIKESFFKAGYPSTGRYFDFDAVRITELDFATHTFKLTLCEELNPKLTKGMRFSGQFGFVGEQVVSLLVL
ncbi:MAG: enterobactin synthetase component D [Phenylobacterium sp.]|jgi:enterobactin synthetase component D